MIYLVLFLALLHSDTILKLKHGRTGDADKVKNTFIFNSLVFCLVMFDFFPLFLINVHIRIIKLIISVFFYFCKKKNLQVFGEFEIRSGDQTLKEILGDNMFLITIGSTILFQVSPLYKRTKHIAPFLLISCISLFLFLFVSDNRNTVPGDFHIWR